MPKKLWTNDQFRVWLAATGLPAPHAANILGVSERTVKRLRNDDSIRIKDAITERAKDYLAASRTTTGTDAEQIDSWASQADLADLCIALPYAHVTATTSAIARGWTSANSAKMRHVAQPIRMPQPDTIGGFRLEWYATTDLPWGVECRVDADGQPYRIASVERTLLDLADHESLIGIDDVIEAFKGAFHSAVHKPDRGLLARKATQRGAETFERIQYYTSSRQLGK